MHTLSRQSTQISPSLALQTSSSDGLKNLKIQEHCDNNNDIIYGTSTTCENYDKYGDSVKDSEGNSLVNTTYSLPISSYVPDYWPDFDDAYFIHENYGNSLSEHENHLHENEPEILGTSAIAGHNQLEEYHLPEFTQIYQTYAPNSSPLSIGIETDTVPNKLCNSTAVPRFCINSTNSITMSEHFIPSCSIDTSFFTPYTQIAQALQNAVVSLNNNNSEIIKNRLTATSSPAVSESSYKRINSRHDVEKGPNDALRTKLCIEEDQDANDQFEWLEQDLASFGDVEIGGNSGNVQINNNTRVRGEKVAEKRIGLLHLQGNSQASELSMGTMSTKIHRVRRDAKLFSMRFREHFLHAMCCDYIGT